MGETKGRREQISRFVDSMVKQGFNPDYAKKKAIQCAVKADRRDSKPPENK